ncbi:MAG: phosphodiester glycosidase family protein [Actinomycetota bacterium]|nr:phosphodiester glycosidase family protein [Actinomycetota bacterium]
MRRFVRLLAAVAPTLACTVLVVPAASAAPDLPAGLQREVSTELTPGLEHIRFTRAAPPLVVNVARVAPDAPVTLRAVLSNEQVAGTAPLLERTSSMCARVNCLVALNGDFAAVGSDQPIGGLVTGGQLLRSPSDTHHQLSVTGDGHLSAGSFEWSGTLVPTDLQSLAVDGVNVPRADDKLVLYTPAFGPTTETAGPGTSLVLRSIQPAGPLRFGQTTTVELASLVNDTAAVPIPSDGAVLSATGPSAGALQDLWARVQEGSADSWALLRLKATTGVVESLGGSPILLRDGRRWFADVDDNFTRGRHPRTLVGWNPSGETLLVTVDGRQPDVSVGMTLAEAADLLLALGATEGINLDGGGSTTFVANGTVANQPSDVAVRGADELVIRHSAQAGDKVLGHVERPVASALAVVPAKEVAVPRVDPLARPSLGLPQALALPAISATDPGSVPDGSLPALVSEGPGDLTDTLRVTAVAANVVVAMGLWVVAKRRKNGRTGGDIRHRPDAPALAG